MRIVYKGLVDGFDTKVPEIKWFPGMVLEVEDEKAKKLLENVDFKIEEVFEKVKNKKLKVGGKEE